MSNENDNTAPTPATNSNPTVAPPQRRLGGKLVAGIAAGIIVALGVGGVAGAAIASDSHNSRHSQTGRDHETPAGEPGERHRSGEGVEQPRNPLDNHADHNFGEGELEPGQESRMGHGKRLGEGKEHHGGRPEGERGRQFHQPRTGTPTGGELETQPDPSQP